MTEKIFDTLEWKHGDVDRQYTEIYFENGLGASIIIGGGAYGTPGLPYEMLFLVDDKMDKRHIFRNNGRGGENSTVEGWLSEEMVEDRLQDLKSAPRFVFTIQ